MKWTILKPKLLELHGRSTSGTKSVLHPDPGNSYNPQTPEIPWPGKIKSSLPRVQETGDGKCPAHQLPLRKPFPPMFSTH